MKTSTKSVIKNVEREIQKAMRKNQKRYRDGFDKTAITGLPI